MTGVQTCALPILVPDIALLAQIAQTTGGRSLDAKSAGQLDDVYRDLRSDVGYEEVKREVTARWAVYAL